MILSEEGLETLMVRVANRLADDPEAHMLLMLNRRGTSPAILREALLACRLEMEPNDLLISVSPAGKHFLYPLGGLIADAVCAELGIHCGFIMQ